MASEFDFSQQKKPVPRPAGRGGPSATNGPRESSALRASVLDAALELGLVGKAGWMFDNVLQEENEDEDPSSSPGLTYGSSVTSDESFPSIVSPSSSDAHTNDNATFFPSNAKGFGGAASPLHAVRREPVVRIVEPDLRDRYPVGDGIPFPESNAPLRPTTPAGSRKLKKKKGADGYESDGGYVSDAGNKKEKKKDKKKEKRDEPAGTEMDMAETSKEAKKRAKEEKKEADAERKRTKSLLSAAKAARKKDPYSGYDTDGGSKAKAKASKKTSTDASGYETDGTPAKKAKSRFFKLGSKSSSKTNLRAEAEAVPPLPFPAHREEEKGTMPLPIAERFATTLSPGFFNTPMSPSSMEGRSLSPLPLLTFQSLGATALSTDSLVSPGQNGTTRTVLSRPALDNRDSQLSETSSTSNGSQSRAYVDSTSSKHHVNDSGTSYSTITSTSGHQYVPSGSPLAPTLSTSSASSAGSKSRGALRPPAVSFSTSRSPSPNRSPPVAPLSIMKGPGLRLKASLDTLIGARNASPSPVSPALSSPFVIVPSPTSLQSSLPSPTTGIPLPPSPLPRSPSEGSSFGVGFGFRTKSPTVQSPRTIISSPNTALNAAASSPAAPVVPLSHVITTGNALSRPSVETPTYLIIPSSQYVVPSPRNSGLPSPNVLAYYDLPPPSPAPQGPLPTLPTNLSPTAQVSNGHSNTHLPSPAALRQRVIDRTPRTLPPELSAALHGQASVQRGRESPFPARPILPVTTIQPAVTGLEARMATRRYRDLYAPLPGGVSNAGAAVDMERYYEEKEQAMELRRARRAGEREHSWIVDAEDADEDAPEDDEGDEADSEELQGVIDRFAPNGGGSSDEHLTARALGRRRSSDALQVNARTGPPNTVRFEFDDDGRTVGDRLSRWSGSIYSRASVLDAEESGETRDRLVKQVEAMLDAERRGVAVAPPVEGERGYVPPVPRLPAAYANMGSQSNTNTTSPGRSWNRF